jgi:hypothetical protein
MKRYQTLAAALVIAVPLSAGVAAGQSKPSCDQAKAAAPQKVDGKVARVDKATGRVAIMASDGKTHEFQADKETVKDMKVGDRIEANLRSIPNC